MLNFATVSLTRSPVDTLVIPVCEDADIHDSPEIQELVALATALQEFSGGAKQQIILYSPPKVKIRRCVFMGLGSHSKLNPESLRSFAGRAVTAAMGDKLDHLTIAVPLAKPMDMETQIIVTAILEGAGLANHRFDKYKENPKDKALKKVSLLVPPFVGKRYQQMAKRIETICQSTLLAREWVNTPANDKVPQQFAQAIEKVVKKANLTVRILDETQLKRQKFGALMAVAGGSAHAPRLVEMVYAPKKPDQTIVLVGKGVTFDTGGINLKTSAGLTTMKADMAGAAAVAATLAAVARLKPNHRVIGITPLVENMLSGSATRPGDIITSYAGKTVEIGNTDAEGRLILIDAMAYAIKKHKPDIVIDLATLTGACVMALGQQIAGVFSPDDELAAAITAAGETTFERCWRMPLPDDYKELLKSELADISNLPSSRYGGAITAALFLSEFVDDTRWAHIDIAGPAHRKKGTDYCGPGASGFGVRLLCELLETI